jgi:hypothetical protein
VEWREGPAQQSGDRHMVRSLRGGGGGGAQHKKTHLVRFRNICRAVVVGAMRFRIWGGGHGVGKRGRLRRNRKQAGVVLR